MSKKRWISDRFWSDIYVENLDPVEKLLFLYFLTNDRTSLCGAYEISLRRVSVQTGIEESMVRKIVERFNADGKISYVFSHVIVWNYKKHQSMNPNMQEGARREYNELPERIREILDKGFESLGKDTLPYLTLLNSTLPNLTSLHPSGTSPDGSAAADKENGEIQEMRAEWKEHTGTTLRNHVPENLRDWRWLRRELGEELRLYLQAVRMIKADKYQKRTLQESLINFVGLRKNLERVEAFMQGKVDERNVSRPILKAS